jgi:hypothetical protein
VPEVPPDDADVQPRFAWERWLGIAVVAACVVLVFGVSNAEMRLWPIWDIRFGNLFRNTTTNGGDMGAHVWWPWFMREHWFGRLRLAGWAPDWYAGFPVGQFYFPLPALLITALDFFIPYNVAFKLVTVSGPLLLPVAAFSFARGLRAPWPMPPAFAVAATVFLFHTRTDWQIYGGNLASNLAGEFSYTLAIALCLFFLGALARTLDTGRRPWLPALLLALTALSHIVVITFGVAGALIIWVTRRPWRTWPIAVAIGVVGGLLSAIWWAPLLLRQDYTQSMRYEKVTTYLEHLRQPTWIWVLAVLGVIGGVVWRRVPTLVVVFLTGTFALAFRAWPADEHVWNTRFLPLYLLSTAFLCAAGAAEVAILVRMLAMRAADWVREGDLADARDEAWAQAGVAEPWPGDPPEWELPEHLRPPELQRHRNLVGALACSVVVLAGAVWGISGAFTARNYLPFWSKWNYEGYEGKPAWGEFHSIMQHMGDLPPGRALWEPSSDIDKYGTTLALELLPYFTQGRIASMEGLYFESSATTNYHFQTVSELTATGKASNPVRGLVYGTIADFDRGVKHLQMLGVRYFMAQSQEAKQRADKHPDLNLVADIPDLDGAEPKGWKVYEVRNAPLVEGLANEPVVVKPSAGTTSSCFGTAKPVPPQRDPELAPWECAAAPWWINSEQLGTVFADDGPDSWERADVERLGSVRERELPDVTVSRVESDVDRISFRVSRPGVPVVVKTSYFPNWRASGADGPWRLSPNLMVVVPTERDVVLTYGVTGPDWIGRLATLLGIVGLVLLVRWRPDPRHLNRKRDAGRDADDDADTLWAEPALGDGGADDPGTERSQPTPALP